MWWLTLLLACRPEGTLDAWYGDWTVGPAKVFDNTCPVPDTELRTVFGFDPATPHDLTVEAWTWDGEPSATEARVSWCLDEACSDVLDGTALLVIDDLGLQDERVRDVGGCAITTRFALFLHCADAEDCPEPVAFVDAEVTGLEGATCGAVEAQLQAESGRDRALLGCDASWLTAPPVESLEPVAGRWHMKDHRTPANTGPTPDAIYEATGIWLRVADEDGGETILCSATSPITNNCWDGYYSGPIAIEQQTPVWRVVIDEESFAEPGLECTLYEEYHSVLVPEGRELWMYTNAEWDPMPGQEEACNLEIDFLEAMGQYDPDSNQDLFEVNRLVRGW